MTSQIPLGAAWRRHHQTPLRLRRASDRVPETPGFPVLQAGCSLVFAHGVGWGGGRPGRRCFLNSHLPNVILEGCVMSGWRRRRRKSRVPPPSPCLLPATEVLVGSTVRRAQLPCAENAAQQCASVLEALPCTRGTAPSSLYCVQQAVAGNRSALAV